jgi:tetratricopeptide (TPR) repeat protein
VERTDPIDQGEFVSAVKPLLAANDMQGLVALLKGRWTATQIISLLNSSQCDARKVAALALSLVGCEKCLPELTKKLKDPDPMVNQMAEHAVWSIWFRLGPPPANCEVHRGVQAMERREFDKAIEHFTRAIELAPDFAEAWNQRATARYLQEQFEKSLDDAKRAVEIDPSHFGAWSGVGHCYAHLGRFREAIDAYRRALAINPNLDCLAEAIEEMRPNIDG